jgi:hypothetical protein
MLFKRNQIEEALQKSLGPSSRMTEMQTRLKRLLDLDRKLGRKIRSVDPIKRNYAFYSGEGEGRGVEVMYSEYAAFAMLAALRLLRHEWPQGVVVDLLRQARPQLEPEHSRIMTLDPATLFDPNEITLSISSTGLDAGTSQPSLLLIVSEEDPRTAKPYPRVFRNSSEAFRFQLAMPGRASTNLELTNPAWALRNNLLNSMPRARGRAS